MMKNREPFNIKPIILAYNVFLVLMHLVIFPFGLWATDWMATTVKCEKMDLTNVTDKFKANVQILLGR